MPNKRKPYVGIGKDGNYYGFSSVETPTRETTPEFIAVIGPFRTRRARLWAIKYGKGNPHFHHVNDAERLSKVK